MKHKILMNDNQTTSDHPETLFVISRRLDAPLDRVYRAWTELEPLKRWWGPADFDVKSSSLDFRRGGTFLYCLQDPDGDEMWGKWVITQILPHRRLEFIVAFCDETGGEPIRHPYEPMWPLEVSTEVIFNPDGDGTRVEVRWLPLNATAAEEKAFIAGHDACRVGWTGTLDKLETHLAAERKVDS
jgi:uncharacterized protein YndB with AHSA1/START domain